MSPEFSEIFFTAGGCYFECACGRTNFAERGHWDWGPDEYEHLERMAKEKPEQYIYHRGDDGVRAGEAEYGRIYVEDCPCGSADALEKLLWDRAADFGRFLVTRAQHEYDNLAARLASAKATDEALTELAALPDQAADARKRLVGEDA